jgi:RNA-directed DNA polymerase
MYTIHNRTSKRTAFELADIGIRFCAIQKSKQLFEMLGTPKKELKALLANPVYKTFSIPKTNSDGVRIIDTPCDGLKTVQRILQDYLQAVYYHIRPRCVHGGIMSAADEVKPRNIVSNARVHIGKKHFLHLDLKNFYHSIKQDAVQIMFASKPFNFSKKVSTLLTKIACHQGRLPMGTSTSGIVANFCLLGLDTKLQGIATKYGFTYSRFIDDITLSCKKAFSKAQIEEIRMAIGAENLVINEDKLKVDTIDDQPVITGLLIVGAQLDIKETYLKSLEADIKLYQLLIQKHQHQSRIFPAHVLQHFKMHIIGQLSFVRQIRGKENLTYIRLHKRMKMAQYGKAANAQ